MKIYQIIFLHLFIALGLACSWLACHISKFRGTGIGVVAQVWVVSFPALLLSIFSCDGYPESLINKNSNKNVQKTSVDQCYSQYSRSSSQCMEEKAKVLSCSATQNDWIIPQVSFADSYSPRFLSRGPKAQEWATRYRHAGILKLPTFWNSLSITQETMDQLGIALHRNLKTSENVWHQNDQNVSTSA